MGDWDSVGPREMSSELDEMRVNVREKNEKKCAVDYFNQDGGIK